MSAKKDPPFKLLGHERIEFLCQSVLDALGAAGLRLNKTLEFIVVDAVEQIVIDVDGLAEAFAVRRAGFPEVNLLVTIQALVGAEDDVQVPSSRHFELLPKLRIDLVAGQLHWGDSWASATMRCTASANVYLVVNCRSRSISLTFDKQASFPQPVKLSDHPLLVPQEPLVHRAIEHLLERVHARFGKLKMQDVSERRKAAFPQRNIQACAVRAADAVELVATDDGLAYVIGRLRLRKLRLDIFTETTSADSTLGERRENDLFRDQRHDFLRSARQVEEGFAERWLPGCRGGELRQIVVVGLAGEEPADDVVGRTTARCLGVEPEIVSKVIAELLNPVVVHRLWKMLEGVVGEVLGVYPEDWLCEPRQRRWHGDAGFSWLLLGLTRGTVVAPWWLRPSGCSGDSRPDLLGG